MNINFCITEKSGKIHPLQDDALWDTPKEDFGTYGFLSLCWHLWKWCRKVKKQVRQSYKMRLADRLNYVFKIRQSLTIETEN